MNKVQELFNNLVKEYNLRAIQISDEVWYAINDLPINGQTIRKRLSEINNSDVTLSNTQNEINNSDVILNYTRNFVENNTKMIYNPHLDNCKYKNFDKVNNAGEKFGTFKMINFLVMSSRLGIEYKLQLINMLDEIRKNDYYVDDNISDENYNKLKQELEQKSVWLRKCFGNTVVHVNKVAKDLGVTVEEVMGYMKKNKWIDEKCNVTDIGGLGKVLLIKNNLYLSFRGINLISNAKSRQENKQKATQIINKNGEKDII